MKRPFSGLCDWLSNKKQRVDGEAGEPSQDVVPFDPLSANNRQKAMNDCRVLGRLCEFHFNRYESIKNAVELEYAVRDSIPVLYKNAHRNLMVARKKSDDGVVSEERLQAIASMVSTEFRETLLSGLRQNNEARATNARNFASSKGRPLPRFLDKRRKVYSIRCGAATFFGSMRRDLDLYVGVSLVSFFIASFVLLWLFIFSRGEKVFMAVAFGISIPTCFHVVSFLWNCVTRAVWSAIDEDDPAVAEQMLREIDSEVESNKHNRQQIRH